MRKHWLTRTIAVVLAFTLVAAGLRRGGARVGLYTSPHVERIHERVGGDGAPVSNE